MRSSKLSFRLLSLAVIPAALLLGAADRLSNDPRVLRWARQEINYAIAEGQVCATNIRASGQPQVLNPATIAGDPTLEKQRASLAKARAVVANCEFQFRNEHMAGVRRRLAALGLGKSDQDAVFDEFRRGELDAYEQGQRDLKALIQQEDEVLVFLQNSHARFDPAKASFVFSNDADIAQFQGLMKRLEDHAAQLNSRAKASVKQAQSVANGP